MAKVIPITEHSGKKYLRQIQSALNPQITIMVDVYCVIEAFAREKPLSAPVQHALKKILCPGNRDKGSEIQDISEAIDALMRHQQMLQGSMDLRSADGVIVLENGTKKYPGDI